MNPLARDKTSTNSNSGCADLMSMAERELSAFFSAVTQLFGSEQAEISAEDWLQELMEVDVLPTSTREWRLISAKVSSRLPTVVNSSSQSTELQIA
jgi:hypothetical protein